jgi:hypothetical protein
MYERAYCMRGCHVCFLTRAKSLLRLSHTFSKDGLKKEQFIFVCDRCYGEKFSCPNCNATLLITEKLELDEARFVGAKECPVSKNVEEMKMRLKKLKRKKFVYEQEFAQQKCYHCQEAKSEFCVRRYHKCSEERGNDNFVKLCKDCKDKSQYGWCNICRTSKFSVVDEFALEK